MTEGKKPTPENPESGKQENRSQKSAKVVPLFEEPKTECVWAGGMILPPDSGQEEEPEAGPAGLVEGFPTAKLCVWVEIEPETFTIYGANLVGPDVDEAEALHSSLQEALQEVRKTEKNIPTRLVFADPEIANQFRRKTLAPGMEIRWEPEIAEYFEDLQGHLDDILQGGAFKDVPPSMMLPIPGEKDIDEEFTRRFFHSSASLWDIAPWDEVENEEVFEAILPDGSSRLVSLMGAGEEEYGYLIFENREEFKGFVQLSSQLLGEGFSQPEEISEVPRLPNTVSLNFEWPEDSFEEHLSIAQQFVPEYDWESQALPMGTKMIQEQGIEKMTREDFELLINISEGFVHLVNRCTEEDNWPPEPGYSCEVPVSGSDRPLTLKFLGDIFEEDGI